MPAQLGVDFKGWQPASPDCRLCAPGVGSAWSQRLARGGAACRLPGRRPRGHPLYLINARLDTALIGGLSIAAWLVISLFDYDGETKPILGSRPIVSVLVNRPNFSATVCRLYQSPEYTGKFPVTASGLTSVMLGTSRHAPVPAVGDDA